MQTHSPKDYGITSAKMKMDAEREVDLTEKLPFKLKAGDFINFAELDMKGSSNRDIVNALSNIKRAIENRMDSLMFAFKYYEIAKNWSFPEKMKKLNKLGIIAPRILAKINRIRNLLEHQYEIPRKQDIEEAYDVAILFLAYTKNFVKHFVDDFHYYSIEKSDDGETEISIWFEFEEDGVKVRIDDDEFHVDVTNPNFDEWTKLAVQTCY